MFRLLIVEDNEETLRQLETFISESFSSPAEEPGIEIDKAMSVARALELIEAASARQSPYDGVVLDFSLPKQLGQPARVDESVCYIIRKLMPSTLVAHITSYQDDELVTDHMRRSHFEDLASVSVNFSKLDHEYPVHLVERMKAYFLSRRIEKQMNEILGEVSPVFLARGRQSQSADSRSRTHALAALCRDIEANWAYLDERVQSRIRDTFKVDTTGGRVMISLLSAI